MSIPPGWVSPWLTVRLRDRRVSVAMIAGGDYAIEFRRIDPAQAGRARRVVTRLRLSGEAARALAHMIVMHERGEAERAPVTRRVTASASNPQEPA